MKLTITTIADLETAKQTIQQLVATDPATAEIDLFLPGSVANTMDYWWTPVGLEIDRAIRTYVPTIKFPHYTTTAADTFLSGGLRDDGTTDHENRGYHTKITITHHPIIPNTTLEVTGCTLYQIQTSLFRVETLQTLAIISLTDTKTNQTGLALMQLEIDKRDINHEQYYTSNPALFTDNHPEQCDLQAIFLAYHKHNDPDAPHPEDNDEFPAGIYDHPLIAVFIDQWVMYNDTCDLAIPDQSEPQRQAPPNPRTYRRNMQKTTTIPNNNAIILFVVVNTYLESDHTRTDVYRTAYGSAAEWIAQLVADTDDEQGPTPAEGTPAYLVTTTIHFGSEVTAITTDIYDLGNPDYPLHWSQQRG